MVISFSHSQLSPIRAVHQDLYAFNPVAFSTPRRPFESSRQILLSYSDSCLDSAGVTPSQPTPASTRLPLTQSLSRLWARLSLVTINTQATDLDNSADQVSTNEKCALEVKMITIFFLSTDE